MGYRVDYNGTISLPQRALRPLAADLAALDAPPAHPVVAEITAARPRDEDDETGQWRSDLQKAIDSASRQAGFIDPAGADDIIDVHVEGESRDSLPWKVIAKYGSGRAYCEDSEGSQWREGCSGGEPWTAQPEITYPGEPVELEPPPTLPPPAASQSRELSDAALDVLLHGDTRASGWGGLTEGMGEDPALGKPLHADPAEAAYAVADRVQWTLERTHPLLGVKATFDADRREMRVLGTGEAGRAVLGRPVPVETTAATLGEASRTVLRALIRDAWEAEAE